MKVGKIVSALGIVLIVVLLLSTVNANAAYTWYTCTVDTVGSSGGVIYIRLTDTAGSPDFTRKWCIIPDNNQKSVLLAVLLSAMANDLLVTAKVDAAVSYPTVNSILVVK